MRGLIIALAFSLVIPMSTRAADPTDREAMDEAIDRALQYLQVHQQNDGAWSAGRAGRSDPAITALCVMAYLSAGHVPGEGPYAEVVEKGIRFVASSQQSNGLFASQNRGQYEMYYHGICTLMVAETIGLMPNTAEAAKLRIKLEKAIEIILKGQRTAGTDAGGWRYQVRGSDSDISVTGWQLMALRAAKNVGCDIPPTAITAAVGYIQRCYDAGSGGYRYQVHGSVTIPCTGTSVLSLELCGRDHHRSREAMKAGSYILRNPLRVDQTHFFYGIYYTSQAMFQLGDNYWKSYRQTLHQLLLKDNPQLPAGGWRGRASDDANFGEHYCTAMGVLALTVEYRYLPIYQRGEEGTEEGGAAQPKR